MCRNKSSVLIDARVGGDKRKEDSKIAARNRRSKESELSDALQVMVSTPYGEQGTVDKTSVIRLAVSYLKNRDIITKGLNLVDLKEEAKLPEFDVVSCLRGFSLVLGPEGDIVHVSHNVGHYVGLGPVELVGQTLADYIHPSDEAKLARLTSLSGAEERRENITVRMKCTVTEKGRVVNLNQASYKPLNISGHIRNFSRSSDEGGITGCVFIGLASPVGPDMGVLPHEGIFVTKHSADMKFADFDTWMTTVAGYSTSSLVHKSFFDFIHTGDLHRVQTAFKNLWEHRVCDTAPYRLLVRGGGYCWIQTSGSCSAPRKGSSKGQTVTCQHSVITEVLDTDQILSLVQIDTNTSPKEVPKSEKSPTNNDKLQEYTQILQDTPVITKIPSPAKPLTLDKKIGPSSLPTSVIVSCPTANIKPSAVTSQIFGQKSPSKGPRASTSNIFSASSQASLSKIRQQPAKSFNTSDDNKIDEEKELFGGLFNFSGGLTETQEEILEALKPVYEYENELINVIKSDECLKINDPKENDTKNLLNKDQKDQNEFLRSVVDVEEIPSLNFSLPVENLSSKTQTENDKDAVRLTYLLNTEGREEICLASTQSADDSFFNFLKFAESDANVKKDPSRTESPDLKTCTKVLPDDHPPINTPNPISENSTNNIDDETVADIFSFTSLFDMNQIGEICPIPSPELQEGTFLLDEVEIDKRDQRDQAVKEVMLRPEQDIMWGINQPPINATDRLSYDSVDTPEPIENVTEMNWQQTQRSQLTRVLEPPVKRGAHGQFTNCHESLLEWQPKDYADDGCGQRAIMCPESKVTSGDKRPHGDSIWRPEKVQKICGSNGDPILFFIVKNGD